MKSRFTALCALAVASLGGCLSEEQFHGTTGGDVQIVATGTRGVILWYAKQQYLTDYDFWGERDGGSQYWVEASNTSTRETCVVVNFDLKGVEPYVVEAIHGRGYIVPPARTKNIASVKLSGERRIEQHTMVVMPDGAWRDMEGGFCEAI